MLAHQAPDGSFPPKDCEANVSGVHKGGLHKLLNPHLLNHPLWTPGCFSCWIETPIWDPRMRYDIPNMDQICYTIYIDPHMANATSKIETPIWDMTYHVFTQTFALLNCKAFFCMSAWYIIFHMGVSILLITHILDIFCPFSQFCEIDVSLPSL